MKIIQNISIWSLGILFIILTIIYVKLPKISFVFSLILLVAVVFILYYIDLVRLSKSIWKNILCIFAITFISRILYIFAMRKHILQISDFNITLNSASTGDYIENVVYYSRFPHKLVYPMVLNQLGLNTQNKILIFQVICVSVIAVIIYNIGRTLFSNNVGILSSLIYIIWPAQIVYTSVISEEHIGALLALILTQLIIYLNKLLKTQNAFNKSFYIKLVELCCLCGVVCGIGTYFKDWCIIIIVACLITGIIYINKFRSKKAILFLMCFLILGGRSVTKSLVSKVLVSKLDGISINTNTLPCYMYVSLHKWNSGAWNPDRYDEYFAFVTENNLDYKAANKVALLKLKSMIKDSPDYLLPLILLKLYTAYNNNQHSMFCAYCAMSEEDQIKFENMFDDLYYMDYIYYMIVVVLVLFSFIINICNKCPRVFLLNLIVVGGILLVIFIESQSRYKYSIQPFWTILSAYSLESIIKFVKTK